VPLILITGGASSGKSSFATDYFKNREDIVFIATATTTDAEMEERIREHRIKRPRDWITLEEPFDLEKTLRSPQIQKRGIIIDCLTLWVSNLIYQKKLTRTEILQIAENTASYAKTLSNTILAVTNELGMGLIPPTPEARLFRRLAGEVNQVFSSKCEKVFLVVSGIGFRIK